HVRLPVVYVQDDEHLAGGLSAPLPVEVALNRVALVGRLAADSLHPDGEPRPLHGRAKTSPGRSGIPSFAFHAVARSGLSQSSYNRITRSAASRSRGLSGMTIRDSRAFIPSYPATISGSAAARWPRPSIAPPSRLIASYRCQSSGVAF